MVAPRPSVGRRGLGRVGHEEGPDLEGTLDAGAGAGLGQEVCHQRGSEVEVLHPVRVRGPDRGDRRQGVRGADLPTEGGLVGEVGRLLLGLLVELVAQVVQVHSVEQEAGGELFDQRELVGANRRVGDADEARLLEQHRLGAQRRIRVPEQPVVEQRQPGDHLQARRVREVEERAVVGGEVLARVGHEGLDRGGHVEQIRVGGIGVEVEPTDLVVVEAGHRVHRAGLDVQRAGAHGAGAVDQRVDVVLVVGADCAHVLLVGARQGLGSDDQGMDAYEAVRRGSRLGEEPQA